MPFDGIGDAREACGDWHDGLVTGVDAHIEVLRGVAQRHRRGGAVDGPRDDADARAGGMDLGDVVGVEELPGRVGVAICLGETDEELEAAVRDAADGLFGVGEPAAEEVAFGAAGHHGAAIAEGVFVIEASGDAVGDDLYPPVWVRREHNVRRHVVVHQGDKRVGLRESAALADDEAPVHAGAGHRTQGRRQVEGGARSGGHRGEGTALVVG